MKEYCYIVGGHCFSVETDVVGVEKGLSRYAPFAIDPAHAPERIFRLKVVPGSELPVPGELVQEFYQDDDGSQIVLSHTPEGASWFEYRLWGTLSGHMLTGGDYTEATMSPHQHPSFGLDNALMTLYALRTARMQTALFHASVIGYEGRGYLFLGKSGTGKSTHARLWLENIPGSELVNDDNPVVRIEADGSVRVYGSPWSGKTDCYRNMDLPAGGFVQLAQAPHNAIRRMRSIEAYASLVTSISGKRWDRTLADGLHATENALVASVPVWNLECLPDAAAARLCRETITKG